jgi:hypothetical protein
MKASAVALWAMAGQGRIKRTGNQHSSKGYGLFPDDFHEGAFAAAAVEFAVEDLFPWAKV